MTSLTSYVFSPTWGVYNTVAFIKVLWLHNYTTTAEPSPSMLKPCYLTRSARAWMSVLSRLLPWEQVMKHRNQFSLLPLAHPSVAVSLSRSTLPCPSNNLWSESRPFIDKQFAASKLFFLSLYLVSQTPPLSHRCSEYSHYCFFQLRPWWLSGSAAQRERGITWRTEVVQKIFDLPVKLPQCFTLVNQN
jgi:hypothetical protein